MEMVLVILLTRMKILRPRLQLRLHPPRSLQMLLRRLLMEQLFQLRLNARPLPPLKVDHALFVS